MNKNDKVDKWLMSNPLVLEKGTLNKYMKEIHKFGTTRSKCLLIINVSLDLIS